MKKLVLILAMVALVILIVFSSAMAANPATCSHRNCGWKTKTAATCTTGGTDWYYCKDCGKNLYYRNTAKNPNNHTSISGWTTVKKATCSSTGSEKRTCNGCQKVTATRTTTKDPNNHSSLSGWTTLWAGNCVTKGTEVRKCNGCMKIVDTREKATTNPNVHESWSEWRQTRKPCYHREGSEYRICKCGKEETRSIPKDPSYTPKWEKTSDQTCTTDEIWTATCPVCRKPEYDTRKYRTGHNKHNDNNDTWPYPNLCEDKIYYEWCSNEGCPLNKKKPQFIKGLGHLLSLKYAPDGRPICARCGKPYDE